MKADLPQASPEVFPEPRLPFFKQAKFKKILPFFLGLVALVLLAEGLVYWWLKQKEPGVSLPEERPLSHREMADLTLDWTAQQKDEKGAYFAGSTISEDGQQTHTTADNRIGVYPLWAQFVYWQKTEDEAALNRVIADLKTFTDEEKIPVYQPSFWSCKILYDLWQEPSLPQAVKDKAQELCYRGLVSFPELEEGRSSSSEIVIKPVLEKDLTRLFEPIEEKTDFSLEEISEFDRKLGKYTTFSSDFTIQYLWDGKENNLVIAKTLFNLALDDYEKLISSGIDERECLAGIAALDLYQATQEGKYFDFAKNLFEKDFQTESRLLFNKATCVLFFNDLNEVSSSETYQNASRALIEEIKADHYDQDLKVFYDLYDSERHVNVKNNSLMMVILLLFD